jgi:hypothetical protein
VDLLLKREFDAYRLRGEAHPVMQLFGIEAVPFRHKDLATWRDSPTGIRSVHHPSGIELFGIIDDLWQLADGSVAVVDYKATSTQAPLSLEGQDGYRCQLECYRWLLQRVGLPASEIAYILYANASREKDALRRRLDFSYTVLPHHIDDTWVEDALVGAKDCLLTESPLPRRRTARGAGTAGGRGSLMLHV